MKKLALYYLVKIIFNRPNCTLNCGSSTHSPYNCRAAKMLTTTYELKNTTYINATSLDLCTDILSCPSGGLLKNSHELICPKKKNVQNIDHILTLKKAEIAYMSSNLTLIIILGFYIKP